MFQNPSRASQRKGLPILWAIKWPVKRHCDGKALELATRSNDHLKMKQLPVLI